MIFPICPTKIISRNCLQMPSSCMTLQNIKSSAIVKSSKLFLIRTSVPNYRRRRYKNRNKREKFLQLFFHYSWRIKPATNEVSNTRRFGIELIPRTKKLLKNVHPEYIFQLRVFCRKLDGLFPVWASCPLSLP